jgi:hypothetical protein
MGQLYVRLDDYKRVKRFEGEMELLVKWCHMAVT